MPVREGKPCKHCGSTKRISNNRCSICDARKRRERRVRKRDARAGISPDHDMTHGTPEGFHLRGTSTLYDGDGKVKVQWVKTQIDPDNKIATLIEAFEEFKDRLALCKPIKLRQKRHVSDLISVYPMGDPHIGMYSWAKETGQDFDLKIAERELCGVADRLIEAAPASEEALVINVGDFFHADNATNRTAASGHALDVDGRWPKVFSLGVRIMGRVIDRALEKHKRVRVINAIGNHDDHSSIMLGLMLEQVYRNEPRVTIDTSPGAFHYYRFGGCLFGVTHGHRAKSADLESIMAHDRADDWSETQGNRYWYTGHIHHNTVQEYRNVIVESFPTLAARDAWHAAQGYRSQRDMRLHVHHRKYGMIEQHRMSIQRFEGDRA